MSSTRLVQLPATDADLLRKIAAVLQSHEPAPNPRYARRCLEEAARLEDASDTPLTASSPIEALVEHGLSENTVAGIANYLSIGTIGELCDQTAENLRDVRNLGEEGLVLLCKILAKSLMGLRPDPNY